jgi:hypothetical protein
MVCRRKLTNREKASLNSETCSSVRESACDRLLAVVRTRRAGHRNVLGAGYATASEGHAPWLLVCGLAGCVVGGVRLRAAVVCLQLAEGE